MHQGEAAGVRSGWKTAHCPGTSLLPSWLSVPLTRALVVAVPSHQSGKKPPLPGLGGPSTWASPSAWPHAQWR